MCELQRHQPNRRSGQATVLLNRFVTARDAQTRSAQCDFRRRKSCIDQIFTLPQVLEQRHKFQQFTIACFVHFQEALYSAHRWSHWRILQSDGMPKMYVRLLEPYYSSTQALVRTSGEESPEFLPDQGVRQGFPLSTILFNCASDWIMLRALNNF